MRSPRMILSTLSAQALAAVALTTPLLLWSTPIGTSSVGATELRAANTPVQATTGLCSVGAVEVGNDAQIQAALTASTDDSIICVTSSITLSQTLNVDDTTVTFEGASGSEVLSAGGIGRVIDANLQAAADDTITIRNLVLSDGLATSGNGGALRIRGTGYIDDSDAVRLQNVTITASRTQAPSSTGGGLSIDGIGQTTFDGVVLRDNSSADDAGGAFVASGWLDIDGLTVISNQAAGDFGGVRLAAQSSTRDSRMTNLQIQGNSAVGDNGGISIFLQCCRTLTLTDSTVADNSSGGQEAGISVFIPGQGIVRNLTVTGNASGANIAGLALAGNADVSFVTVTGNTAAGISGGVWFDDTTFTLTNSIIAGNDAASAQDVHVVTSGMLGTAATYSIFGSPTSVNGVTFTSPTITYGDPLLNALADNGGSTLTMLPLWNSPVVGAGDPLWVAPPTYDQRGIGFPRDAGGRVSMGAIQGASAPPPPPAPNPPTAPVDVQATAGDQSATVTWSKPTSSGSFPISYYQIRSIPESRGCLTTNLTCDIDGLINGVSYTFEVRALNGAGWGPWSQASEAVRPSPAPSILITGSRAIVEGRNGVRVSGETTGLIGEQVTPWVRFPGPHPYSAGSGVRTVDDEGRFTWQRQTSKRVYVYFRAEDVKSNRVIIRR